MTGTGPSGGQATSPRPLPRPAQRPRGLRLTGAPPVERRPPQRAGHGQKTAVPGLKRPRYLPSPNMRRCPRVESAPDSAAHNGHSAVSARKTAGQGDPRAHPAVGRRHPRTTLTRRGRRHGKSQDQHRRRRCAFAALRWQGRRHGPDRRMPETDHNRHHNLRHRPVIPGWQHHHAAPRCAGSWRVPRCSAEPPRGVFCWCTNAFIT
jgi:hypothetical protein